MIHMSDYLMGRQNQYGHLLGTDLVANAHTTIECVNKLLVLAKMAGVGLESHPRTGSIVSSGWRPPAINNTTPGAAVRSLHLQCRAIDLFDPDGDIDDWLMTDDGQRAIKDLGLWMEHPAATKGWAHLQTRPPKSGRRVFYP
jgi:hypothetical protein